MKSGVCPVNITVCYVLVVTYFVNFIPPLKFVGIQGQI